MQYECREKQGRTKMTTQKISTFNIIRRAYSEYEHIETFTGTWVEATNHAMSLQSERRDGEYMTRRPGEPNKFDGSAYQSGFDYL